jgi:hypothetical protein
MARRYLLAEEAQSAIKRGRAVECFIGACRRDDRDGIQWFSIRASEDQRAFVLRGYETADLGNTEYLDLYEFGPLNPDLEIDEPDERIVFEDFNQLLRALDARFPGSSAKLVNEGVVQDEYRAFTLGRSEA